MDLLMLGLAAKATNESKLGHARARARRLRPFPVMSRTPIRGNHGNVVLFPVLCGGSPLLGSDPLRKRRAAPSSFICLPSKFAMWRTVCHTLFKGTSTYDVCTDGAGEGGQEVKQICGQTLSILRIERGEGVK